MFRLALAHIVYTKRIEYILEGNLKNLQIMYLHKLYVVEYIVP